MVHKVAILRLTFVTFLYQSASDATEQRILLGEVLEYSSSSDEFTSTWQSISRIISFRSRCFISSQHTNKTIMKTLYFCPIAEVKMRTVFFKGHIFTEEPTKGKAKFFSKNSLNEVKLHNRSLYCGCQRGGTNCLIYIATP